MLQEQIQWNSRERETEGEWKKERTHHILKETEKKCIVKVTTLLQSSNDPTTSVDCRNSLSMNGIESMWGMNKKTR